MKPKSIFWGVFFILAAILVFASGLGVFAGGGIGIWTMLATAGLVAIIIKSIPGRNFSGVLLPLAIGYILYEKPLGLPHISWWLLFGAAILMSIGLQILFRRKPDYNWDYSSNSWGTCDDDSYADVRLGHNGESIKHDDYVVLEGEGDVHSKAQPDLQASHGGDDNHPFATVKLGAASKYIHGQSLETGYFKSKLGALEVYFDSATLSPNGADIFVDVSLGAITLYVPRGWRLRPELNVVIGGVDDPGEAHPAPGAPELRITGNITMGGLEIKYI